MSGPTASLRRDPAVRRLVWCAVAGGSGFALLLAALPLWAVRTGVDPARAGLVTTTTTLAATVATQFAVPAVVARWGAGRALAAGLLLLGAPAPLYAVLDGLPALLTLSAVRGVGFGLFTVVGSLLVALLAPQRSHGRAAGMYGLALSVPSLPGVPGGVLLGEQVSFPLVLVLAAGPLLGVPAALGFGALGARASPGHAPPLVPAAPDAAHLPRAAGARGALVPAAVLLTTTLAGGGVVTFVPIAAPGAGLAAGALLAFGVTTALARWLVGGLADRRGPRGLLVLSLLATASGTVLVGTGLAGVGTTVGAVALCAGTALAGAGYGAVQNLTLVLSFSRSGPGASAGASAVWNAAFDTGTAVGAFAVGAVAAAGAGLPLGVGLTAVLVVAAVPVAAGLRR